MAVIDVPGWLPPAAVEWGIQKAGLQFASPHNGTVQAVQFIGERWVAGLRMTPELRHLSGRLEALHHRLAGGIHRLRMHHLIRPEPLGSLRGVPVLAAPTTRGADTLQLTVDAGATLEAGDMLGLPGHLLQVAEPAQAVGTSLTVLLVNRVRGPIAAGTPVVWDRPTAHFIVPAMSARVTHLPGFMDGPQFDLMEVW